MNLRLALANSYTLASEFKELIDGIVVGTAARNGR
jgi:hypothetical protein